MRPSTATFREGSITQVVLGHGTETILADTLVGVVIALALFALYYVLILQRAREE